MSDAQVVWVASTSPLTVREGPSSTPVAARPLRGSSYTPATGDAVVVVFARGVYYLLGGA